MSKKLILFLMVLLFGSTSFLRADEVTIGDPTSTVTSSYLPTYSLYNYSFTQQIYTADEIGMSGTINEFTMWLKNSSSYARNLNVYMKEVSEATFESGSAWVSMTADDLVGTLTLANGITNPVATTITLTTPFNYSGDNNLVICFQDVTGSWSSGAASVVMTGNGNQAIYAYRDGSLYDPTTPGVNGTTMANKSVVMLDITPGSGPIPPTPTGNLTVTPMTWDLGLRPTNGWMEPFEARIENNGPATVVEGSMSNTSGVTPFELSEEINQTLETGEFIDFEVDWNNVAAGEYAEEFTLFYAETRDIITVPVTATLYVAGEADIVETAKTLSLSYTAGVAQFSHTPANLHANYMGFNQNSVTDAVYQFTLVKDAKISVNADGFIGIYNKVLDFHPTIEVEPVAMTITGTMTDQVLLAGEYYMIVAGENITTVEGTVEQVPAPTDITNLAPVDGATGLEGNIVLSWEGGENATQYQVLFGTSPVNMAVAQDWTVVDAAYGTFDVTNLVQANTQYFWQIKAKNSNGTVTGPRWGFTTALIVPSNVTASEEEIFVDETTLIKWKLAGTGGFTGELTVADGTETNSYVPVYGLWCDYYTRSEMIYPAEMLEEMEGGEITSLTFYLSSPATATWAPDVFQVYFQEVDATTLSTYYTATNAQISYTGFLDGTGTTMVITLDEPYTYGGGNLLLGIQEIEKGTYKSASFYGVTATGASASGYNSSALASVTFNQRNFLPKVTFTCGGKGVAQNRAVQGFNVYYGDVKANTSLITENKYLLGNLPYNVTPGHDVTVTAVYDEGESQLSTPVVVKVSGYGTLTGTVRELISNAPVAGVTVKFNGMDEFNNVVAYQGTTNASGVYTIENAKAGNYNIGKAEKEGMETAYMENAVTLAYEGTQTVNFTIHEVYNPVMSVVAEEMDAELARVKWSMTEVIPVPNPGGNTPGGNTPVADASFNFDDNTMMGWTSIDGDGDGNGWVSSANPGIYHNSGVSLAGTGHNASEAYVISGSYANQTGQALTPNNFLVSPEKAGWTSISFFACAQDASYAAEHFGVAVSTTGNTSAADFTTIAEWTMTAKGEGAMSVGRDGQIRQGNWYEKTVDFSAYAGQDIWVAIRHFNCTDMFILNVDDITLHGSAKSRDVQQYAVYRKAILKENEIVPADSVCFGNVTDTLYADFGWANMEPGLYQYGVSAIYPSPAKGRDRSEIVIDFETGDFSQFPQGVTNSTTYPWTVVDGGHSGKAMKTSNGGVASSTSQIDATVTLPTDGNISFWALCMGEGTSTIWDKCIFELDGTQMFCYGANQAGWNEYSYDVEAGEHTLTWKYSKDGSVNPTGDYMMVDDITLTYEGGGAGNDDPVTPIVWSNVLPKDIKTTVVVNATLPDASAEGVKVRFDNVFENTSFTITLDETGTDTITDFRKGEYLVTFIHEDYVTNFVNVEESIWGETTLTATFEEIFHPVPSVSVSRSGYASWDAIVPVNDRFPQYYMVKLDNLLYAETTDNFIQIDEDDLTVGTTYTVSVAVVYTTGMSAYTSASFTYTDCTGASHQVEELTAANEPCNTNVTLAWNGATPNPNPNPNPNPGTGTSFNFDDNTMMGWTSIDGDGDGNGWVSSANPGIYHNSGVSLAGTGHNASQAYVISGSYANQTGQALTPNNFLVSPAKGQYTQIKFYACAQDASYAAEHFGVAVSTAGNTSAADFTTVQEWTLTAKGEGAMSEGRNGQTRTQGAWYEKTVDLSAYAGQEIWVAIRHFNCTDQFILNVDDIELTTPAKELAAGTVANAGTGFGMINNAMTRDGNWYYYDNGENNDAIGLTSGGSFYWGIMFPAGTYEGNRLTKIAYFDYTAHTGNVIIYQGGSSAPGTQVYTQPYSVSGTQVYVEIEMDEPVELDDTQNVWVVMHNNNGQYVAAIDGSAGVNYGSCLSTDGGTWYTMVNQAASSLDGNWNLRAYIETGSGPAPAGLVANKYNIFFDGELVGATASSTFTYDAADFAEHTYVVVWVDSDYLVSCVDENNTIVYAAECDNVDENEVVNSIYPNPTSGDLYINAMNMTRINIVNTMGQVVYEQEVNADEMVIDMAKFEAGVYMVNIYTENGSSVKRVTVVK